jgi:hypothetical protein
LDVEVMSAACLSAIHNDDLVGAYITSLLLQSSDLVNRSLEVSTLIVSFDYVDARAYLCELLSLRLKGLDLF